MYKGNEVSQCKSIGCFNPVSFQDDLCKECEKAAFTTQMQVELLEPENLSDKYPQYYKPVGELTEVDVYAVHKLFDIHDPSGCIHHSSKKLLLSGVRTGGKSKFKDVKEARDTLTRWLQLNLDLQ